MGTFAGRGQGGRSQNTILSGELAPSGRSIDRLIRGRVWRRGPSIPSHLISSHLNRQSIHADALGGGGNGRGPGSRVAVQVQNAAWVFMGERRELSVRLFCLRGLRVRPNRPLTALTHAYSTPTCAITTQQGFSPPATSSFRRSFCPSSKSSQVVALRLERARP